MCRRRKLCDVGKTHFVRSTHTTNARHIGMQFHGHGGVSAARIVRTGFRLRIFEAEARGHATTLQDDLIEPADRM